MDLKDLMKKIEEYEGKEIKLEGWIKNHRKQKEFGFIDFNDGTCFETLQVVYDDSLTDFEEIQKLHIGSAVEINGKIISSEGGKQNYEMRLASIKLLGDCPDDYPLQSKGRPTKEFLREIAYLRPRTNLFNNVFRVRSIAAYAIHKYFQDNGYVYFHAPIITSSDCEGAGEMFQVTTLDLNKIAESGKVDYSKDFFGKTASLTVSGQLEGETYAMAYKKIYTFGPTFRAENSNTTTHASEFWMIEPEIAFADLVDDMNLIEDMVKYCIEYVMNECEEEMKFFNEFIDKTLLERLEHVKNSKFERLPYTKAIEILEKADVEFENKVSWGMDLNTEHERYICEKVINGPVFITDYPKDIKAFYMRLNDDGQTVAACDLLVPSVGELVGGSQREERLDYLIKRMEEMNVHRESLEWYLDLRRYGGCKHAGFGLGFERFIMYITGIQNIRDVIPFARTPKNLLF